MLLGGESGQRVEDVRVMRRTLLDGPVLHRGSYVVGEGRVEWNALVDGCRDSLEDVLGQAGFHRREGEDVAAEGVCQWLGEAVAFHLVRGHGLDGLTAGHAATHT